MPSTLKMLGGICLAVALFSAASAQSQTAAEKKCIAFQKQLKACNAAMSNPAGKIPPGCAAILKTAAIKPCG
jgi:hypothetical protein